MPKVVNRNNKTKIKDCSVNNPSDENISDNHSNEVTAEAKFSIVKPCVSRTKSSKLRAHYTVKRTVDNQKIITRYDENESAEIVKLTPESIGRESNNEVSDMQIIELQPEMGTECKDEISDVHIIKLQAHRAPESSDEITDDTGEVVTDIIAVTTVYDDDTDNDEMMEEDGVSEVGITDHQDEFMQLLKKSVCHECDYVAPSPTSLIAHMREHVPNLLQCPICEADFVDCRGLNHHLKQHNIDPIYACKRCNNMTFKTKRDLEIHAKTHKKHITSVNLCPLCGFEATTPGGLRSHKKTHSELKPYHCMECPYQCKSIALLKTHLRRHTGEKPFMCATCGKSFAASTGLSNHIKHKHTLERAFACLLCEKKFAQSGGLTIHMRVHTNERPFGCTDCGEKFKHKTNLQTHVRQLHTFEKPFVCSDCGYRTVTQSHLDRHAKRHTGDKPHKCTLCDAAFIQKVNLTSHMRVHNNENPFACTICTYTCKQGSNLKTHMHRLHGDKSWETDTVMF